MENYIAGALVIATGFIVLYYYNKKRKAGNDNRYIYMLAIGIGELILGCLGIYFNSLDGINILIYGITMFWFMSNEQAPSDINLKIMHNKGWLSAIIGIIAGILIILDHLNIFSLWRDL